LTGRRAALILFSLDGGRRAMEGAQMSTTTPVDGFSFDPVHDLFDPFAPGVMDDPFPYYAVLRDRAPVHFNPQLGMYFLSRYDDVFRADADLARFARGGQASAYDSYTAATRVIFNNNLFAKDPPDHTRLKRLFSRAFTRSLVEGMRPRIEELCRQVLDDADLAPGGGTMELIGDFAYPFPSLVICEMLGIPSVHQTDFRDWTDGLVPLIDPVHPPEIRARGEVACAAMVDYLARLIAERRGALRAGERPAGLMTALVEAAGDGDLSDDELIMLASVLVVAGFETTANTVAFAIRALIDQPDQLEALRADPTLFARLPDEVVRLYSTAQNALRETTEDAEFAGTTIPRGSWIILLRGAANRDERHFPDPDALDVRRRNSADHVGFGEGVTFCTGAGLARIEVEVALRTLLERITPVRITRWEQRPSKRLWGPSLVELEYRPATG
jgi:pimeloyl-[acyl-carrier protein] synthase